MNSSSSILNVILIFIVTFTVAYMFGFMLVRMMDQKLDQIKSEVSAPLLENFKNMSKQTSQQVVLSQTVDLPQLQSPPPSSSSPSQPIEKPCPKFDNEYYEQMNQYNQIEGFTSFEEPKPQSLDWDATSSLKKDHVCFKNHVHTKNGKDSNCQYGVTNYLDPKDMTPVDYQIFILNYPPNFTLQDYINWLWCFRDRKDQLTYNHLRNLEKLEMGKELKEEQGVCPPPSYYHAPMNSEDYFEKLYNNLNEFQIAESLNSVTGPMLGYNYNQYSEFTQNQDVYGSTGQLRNPDIGLKKTAREVDNYIIPHDSQNLEIEKAYKPYHVKQVEI